MVKMIKKTLVFLLAFAMMLTTIPMEAHAEQFKSLDNFKKVQDYEEGMFNDVKPGDWYHENVSSVYEINLMIGREKDMFDAEENMTVAEAFTIAARLNSIYYTGKADFVQGELWYEVYTNYCKANNIADPSKYDLEKTVTRGEFAEIFSKALPEEVLEEINKIKDGAIPDVKMNDAFSAAIYMLYRVGILTGIDEYGTFGSERSIKRMEVAAITTRMARPSLRKSVELKDPEVEPQKEETKKKKKSSGPAETLIPFDTLDFGTGWSKYQTQLAGYYNGPTDRYSLDLDNNTFTFVANDGYYFEGECDDAYVSIRSDFEIVSKVVERKKLTISYMFARTIVPLISAPTLTPVDDGKFQVSYITDTGVESLVIDPVDGTSNPDSPGYQWVDYTAASGYRFTDATVVKDILDKDGVTNQDGTKKYVLKVGEKKYDNNNSLLKVKYDFHETGVISTTPNDPLGVTLTVTANDFEDHMPEHISIESITPTDYDKDEEIDDEEKVVVKFKADDDYYFDNTTDAYKPTIPSTTTLEVTDAIVDETQKYLTVTYKYVDPSILVVPFIPAPKMDLYNTHFFTATSPSATGIEANPTYRVSTDGTNNEIIHFGDRVIYTYKASDGYKFKFDGSTEIEYMNKDSMAKETDPRTSWYNMYCGFVYISHTQKSPTEVEVWYKGFEVVPIPTNDFVAATISDNDPFDLVPNTSTYWTGVGRVGYSSSGVDDYIEYKYEAKHLYAFLAANLDDYKAAFKCDGLTVESVRLENKCEIVVKYVYSQGSN